MTKPILVVLTVLGGFALAGAPALTYMFANQAAAAETTTTKKKKKATARTNFNQPTRKKGNYNGYPEEPIPDGMSDYCSYMYNIYNRRGVGCNKYGHSFMFND